MPLIDLDELPRGARPHPAVVGPPAGARAVPPRRLPRRPRPRCADARDLVEARSAAGRRARSGCSPSCAPGRRLQPRLPLFCYAAGGERVDCVIAEVTNTPWGERTPTCSTRRATPPGRSRATTTRRCTSHRSSAWTSATTRGDRARRRAAASHLGASRRRAGSSTPRCRCAAASSSRARMARLLLRYPPMTSLRLARGSTRTRCGSSSRAPVHPHPRRADSDRRKCPR